MIRFVDLKMFVHSRTLRNKSLICRDPSYSSPSTLQSTWLYCNAGNDSSRALIYFRVIHFTSIEESMYLDTAIERMKSKASCKMYRVAITDIQISNARNAIEMILDWTKLKCSWYAWADSNWKEPPDFYSKIYFYVSE